MKQRTFKLFLSLAGLMMLGGCGGGGGTSGTALHESQECIGCHDGANWKTPGSGQPIVAEWKASTHNTNDVAGCKDCHGSGYMHPNSCNKCHSVGITASNPRLNPDADGMCANCHDKTNPRPGQNDGFNILSYSANGIPAGSTTAYTHFSTGRHGNYVSTNYKHNCRKCHNPHNTSFGSEERKQWAESGHGSTTASFRTGSTDFKGRGSRIEASGNYGPFCVRCHTSTGYLNFVNSNFSNVNALPDTDSNKTQSNYPEYIFVRNTPDPYVYQDKSRETINCDVCHSDGRSNDGSAYSGRLRNVVAPTVWYTYSTHPNGGSMVKAKMEVQFDDLGTSNTCVVCHAGREGGDIIKVADRLGLFTYNLAIPPSGITPHDYAAGANLQGKSGFHFYIEPGRYSSNPAHKTRSTEIGGVNGSCIGCHMTNSVSHNYLAVSWNNDSIRERITDIRSQSLCNNCHTDVSNAPTRNASNMNAKRDAYRASIAALRKALAPVLDVAVKNQWKKAPYNTGIVPGSGPGPGYTGGDAIDAGAYTMGANFVYNLFLTDPGAYVHNPTYTKQLIYDSIDWLFDGNMDFNGDNATEVFGVINGIGTPLYWTPSTGVNYGQNGVLNGTAFTKQQVYDFLCKNYIDGSGRCERW